MPLGIATIQLTCSIPMAMIIYYDARKMVGIIILGCVCRDKKITHIYNKHIHLIVKYQKRVHDNVNFDCLFVIQKYGYFSSNGKIQRKPFLIYTVVEITQHLKTVGNVLINST